ncbi:N-acetylmuramoyl-L-alanine amidase family protein [Allofustis seminis]|uniref:N-acetylmuramoyl-L-alanine amidase family protein n=1 Tax=Allofustis seminis TaxID=166939 RepID=UPI00037F776C|nr:N-acetylmuramoyl-L-alanine amidase [Allofustis seminis]
MKKTIIIDPGHGGAQKGATARDGTAEKDLNLKISLYQYEQLKQLGVPVALTRKKDETLAYQSRAARVKGQYDLCLSNHFNAADGQSRGVEALHSIADNSKIARPLVKAIAKIADIPYRRCYSHTYPNGKDYCFMHRLTHPTPTIILNYGFIDNLNDWKVYADEKKFYQIADAVVSILAEYSLGTFSESIYSCQSNEQYPTVGRVAKGTHLLSIHHGPLKIYTRPSWNVQDILDEMSYGDTFEVVHRKIAVDGAYQYEVQYSKERLAYVTAHPQAVHLI